jgi:chromosome segregation ATPase
MEGLFADPFADPFAETSTSTSAVFNPFADTANIGMGAAAPAQTQAQYGGFNASEVGTASMANDIRRTQQAIQNSIDAFNDKIEDANDELNDYNAELRPLLERRKVASPSECLALDGQIDQINAKRGSVIYKIKRFRQEQAQLNDKLALLDKLSAQQDLASTNAQIEQITGGKFADFAGLAMFLNDAVRESNEQLEEIGTAINVAESEEIMMNSASAAGAALSDAGALGKDEHKYDSLEADIGMATPVAMPLSH